MTLNNARSHLKDLNHTLKAWEGTKDTDEHMGLWETENVGEKWCVVPTKGLYELGTLGWVSAAAMDGR